MLPACFRSAAQGVEDIGVHRGQSYIKSRVRAVVQLKKGCPTTALQKYLIIQWETYTNIFITIYHYSLLFATIRYHSLPVLYLITYLYHLINTRTDISHTRSIPSYAQAPTKLILNAPANTKKQAATLRLPRSTRQLSSLRKSSDRSSTSDA